VAKQPKQRVVYTVGDLRDFLSTAVRQREIPKSMAPTECEKQIRRFDSQRQPSQSLERVSLGRDKDGRARWATRSAWLKDSTQKDERIIKR